MLTPRPRPGVLTLIGNTPLLEVTRLDTGPCRLFLKLESQNPGGSIKDRIGLWMIEGAERRGQLQPGGTIVEATAGNTGLGLALVARCSCKGLSRRARRARQDVEREGAAPEGARRRGAHDALRRRARSSRLLSGRRRAPRGRDPRRVLRRPVQQSRQRRGAPLVDRPRIVGAERARNRRDRLRHGLRRHVGRAHRVLSRGRPRG